MELIGLNPQKFPPENGFNELEMMIIFAYHPLGDGHYAQLKSVLEEVPFSVLFTAHQTTLMNQVTVVLPALLLAEKEGSVINVEGKLQQFKAALHPPGNAHSEGEALLAIGRNLGINFSFYRNMRSTADILGKLSQDISFFEGQSD